MQNSGWKKINKLEQHKKKELKTTKTGETEKANIRLKNTYR